MRWLDGITNSMNVGLGTLLVLVTEREALSAAIHGVPRSWTWLSDWTELKGNSICQWILKTQQRPQNWKTSAFIPIPKKGSAKECSNDHTIAFISHTSKVMFNVLQARLQKYMNWELPDVQDGLRKGRGTRDQIVNTCWMIEKNKRISEKHLLLLHWLHLWLSLWLCGSQQAGKLLLFFFFKFKIFVFILFYFFMYIHIYIIILFYFILFIFIYFFFSLFFFSFFFFFEMKTFKEMGTPEHLPASWETCRTRSNS